MDRAVTRQDAGNAEKKKENEGEGEEGGGRTQRGRGESSRSRGGEDKMEKLEGWKMT